MLAHIHPSYSRFTCGSRPLFNGYGYPGSMSRTGQGPPSAQSPLAPGQVLPAAAWPPGPHQRALPLLHHAYGLMRQSKFLPMLSAQPYPSDLGGLCINRPNVP